MKLSEMALAGLTAGEIERVLFGRVYETPADCDAVLLLGTAPAYAAKRAEIAVSLWHKAKVGRIIATGGAVSDKTVRECEVMKRTLLSAGVPEEVILEEPDAYDTVGNMICSMTALYRRHLTADIRRVTIVTEPFHMRRSLLLAQSLLPRYLTIGGYTEGTEAQRAAYRHNSRLAECVAGEMRWLCAFAARGLIADEEALF